MSDLRSIDSTPCHARPAGDAAHHFGVEPGAGISAAEAGRRLETCGPNRLAEASRMPWWRAFLRQFQDLLIVILLVAAVVSLVVSREWETPAAIAFVVLLNAVIGFAQESRAQASLDALRRMSVTTATVRRDGRIVRLDAGELVPGDVVVVEPGIGCPRMAGCFRQCPWRCRSRCSPARRSRWPSRRRARSTRGQPWAIG
jgi:Ca2+-transporting ATPase